jgi:tungstate transport system substrate-binding protein
MKLKNNVVIFLIILISVTACSKKNSIPIHEEYSTGGTNKVIRLSTTTSVNDSGLLDFILPDFESETGYKIEIISNGSGAAIKLGESGDADVLLVHSEVSEEEFVKAGFGISRISFMYNYFVVVGPNSDPAEVYRAKNATEAFSLIRENQSPFVSRGDDSGTNKAELEIWANLDMDTKEINKWYVSSGLGMGAALNMASEKLAYTLSDKSTFLSKRENMDIDILLDSGDDMKNIYSIIVCNPEKNEFVNFDGATVFANYMTSEATLEKIATFGKESFGEQLFYTY